MPVRPVLLSNYGEYARWASWFYEYGDFPVWQCFDRIRKGIFLGTTNVIPTLSAVNALPSAAVRGVNWSGAAPCGFQGPGLD
jgi:hypothetical protein